MLASGEAFAPAAISNFFTIEDDATLTPDSDLSHVGARGGGYMLSKGVRTQATVVPAPGFPPIVGEIVVNGDAGYDAKTTRLAAEMLLRAAEISGISVRLDQDVEVPIGSGFGASAASALSAVNAIARALSLEMPPERVAYFAHAADILCRTGLGTVSVIYRYGGAGIIVKAGAPGVAEVKAVQVPPGVRVVTASLAPYVKSLVLSSPETRDRVNRLGGEALSRAGDLTLESLVRAGEVFSESLGLESPQVKHLIKLARERGAMGASQNMVGHAVHSIVWEEDSERVARAFESDPLAPQVDVYEFGGVR